MCRAYSHHASGNIRTGALSDHGRRVAVVGKLVVATEHETAADAIYVISIGAGAQTIDVQGYGHLEREKHGGTRDDSDRRPPQGADADFEPRSHLALVYAHGIFEAACRNHAARPQKNAHGRGPAHYHLDRVYRRLSQPAGVQYLDIGEPPATVGLKAERGVLELTYLRGTIRLRDGENAVIVAWLPGGRPQRQRQQADGECVWD